MLLLAAVTSPAQEWIYVARGEQYVVVDPADGAIVASERLATASFEPPGGQSPDIVPTPGGRYVFFFYPDADAAVVVDAESHEVVWSVELPAGSERLDFSSMGDALFVQTAGGRMVLPHRRGEVVGPPEGAPELDDGAVAFNRRATRIYGQRGNRLVYLLARNGDSVAEVLVGGEHDWRISPSFRYLLGTARDGSGIVLVDEQRARVVGTVDEPLTPRSVGFTQSSRELYFLSSDGRTIVVAETRRFRVTERIRIDWSLATLWKSGSGYHGLTADGSALVLDAIGSGTVVDIREALNAASAGSATDAGEAEVVGALVELKPGQGFACF
jgi:DNA-binding beta-propeller fold protein YncE